jgi:predicted RNA-binding protein with PIN domain
VAGAAVTFLIDGYNLMHAVGLLGHGRPAAGLERTRTRFLDWLADGVKDRPELLRVVFDAEKGPGRSPETDHRGVRVRFAFRRTADDEIEELLAAEPHPAGVTVVSNDARVRDAGRHRGAAVHTCTEFVDWLITKPATTHASGSPEAGKPEPTATPDEMAAWLAEFSKPPPNRRKR